MPVKWVLVQALVPDPGEPIPPLPNPPGIWGGGNQPFPTPPINIPGTPPPLGIWGGANQPFPGYGLPSKPPGIWGGGNQPFPTPPIQIKPPGIPIIPIDPDWEIPAHLPAYPGDWIPIDPGPGLPPIYGWLPVDPGYGVSIERPNQDLPGHWVPVQLPVFPPETCCDSEKKPTWVWIPEIGPEFGKKQKKSQTK